MLVSFQNSNFVLCFCDRIWIRCS